MMIPGGLTAASMRSASRGESPAPGAAPAAAPTGDELEAIPAPAEPEGSGHGRAEANEGGGARSVPAARASESGKAAAPAATRTVLEAWAAAMVSSFGTAVEGPIVTKRRLAQIGRRLAEGWTVAELVRAAERAPRVASLRAAPERLSPLALFRSERTIARALSGPIAIETARPAAGTGPRTGPDRPERARVSPDPRTAVTGAAESRERDSSKLQAISTSPPSAQPAAEPATGGGAGNLGAEPQTAEAMRELAEGMAALLESMAPPPSLPRRMSPDELERALAESSTSATETEVKP